MYKKIFESKIIYSSFDKHVVNIFYFFIVLLCSISSLKACKLWATSSKIGVFSTLSPSEIQEINSQLTSFFHQSATMMDGWSLMGYGELDSDSLAFVQRSSIPATHDSILYWSTVDTLLGNSESSIALGHLRMASSGAISIPNPHPWIFHYNNKLFSLIHNGTINKDILYNIITDEGNDLSWIESYPPQTFGGGDWSDGGWNSVIDSQLILLIVMREYFLNGYDLISALQTSFSKLISAGVSASQLNIIFSDGEVLYAFGGSGRLFFQESSEHFSIMTTPSQSNGVTWSGLSNQELLEFLPVGYNRYPNFVSNTSDESIIVNPESFSMGAAYPNPFNGNVNFSVTSTKESSILISILSLDGKLIKEFKSYINKNDSKVINWIPDSNLSSGIYLVLVGSELDRKYQKISFIK